MEPQLGAAIQPAQVDPLAPAHPNERRRLTKKTAGATKALLPPGYRSGGRKLLYACGPLLPADQAVAESFQAAFQVSSAMDFYITKYQGKMMESMTPRFQSMLGGMQRLEQQEREEQEEEARKLLYEGGADGGGGKPGQATPDARGPGAQSAARLHPPGFDGEPLFLDLHDRGGSAHFDRR